MIKKSRKKSKEEDGTELTLIDPLLSNEKYNTKGDEKLYPSNSNNTETNKSLSILIDYNYEKYIIFLSLIDNQDIILLKLQKETCFTECYNKIFSLGDLKIKNDAFKNYCKISEAFDFLKYIHKNYKINLKLNKDNDFRIDYSKKDNTNINGSDFHFILEKKILSQNEINELVNKKLQEKEKIIQELNKNFKKCKENFENIGSERKEKNVQNNIIHQASKNIKQKSNCLNSLLITIFIFLLIYLIINILILKNKYPQSFSSINKNNSNSNYLTEQQIDILLENCNDSEIYNNIQQEIFKNGIFVPNKIFQFLQFPNLSKNEIEKNINQNIEILINLLYKIDENTDLYNSLSSIFASFLGDTLGSFCEFKMYSRENSKNIFIGKNVFGAGKGRITDDSEMSMSLAFAIMDTPEKNTLNSEFISYYYGLWYLSESIDMGMATRNALQYYKTNNYNLLDNKSNNYFNKVKNIIENENYNTLANGFLMRKSVFYVWVYYRYYQQIKIAFEECEKNNSVKLYELFKIIKKLSKLDDECTHPNPESTSASAYMTLMALGTLNKIEPSKIIKNILNMIKLITENKNLNADNLDIELGKYIINFVDIFNDEKFDFWSFFTSNENNVCDLMGWYKHSFKLTLYFVTNFNNMVKNKGDKNVFRYIIENICDLGGDTDTNAAIVGGVIGPLIGYNIFKEDLNIMLKKGRKVFYPIFMLLYLDYIQKSMKSEGLIYNKKNFIKMIATIIYGKIDENKLLF